MRKFAALLFLLLCSTLAWSADKPNPTEYPIKVHISASHMLPTCEGPGCGFLLYADAIGNGKKIELSGSAENIIKHQSVLIIPGDYQASITKDIHNADSTVIRQEYDLLLPDGTVWKCSTSGISE